MNRFPIDANAGTPFLAVGSLANTKVSGRSRLTGAVVYVLTKLGNAKVRAATIQSVAIRVVNELPLLSIENEAVKVYHSSTPSLVRLVRGSISDSHVVPANAFNSLGISRVDKSNLAFGKNDRVRAITVVNQRSKATPAIAALLGAVVSHWVPTLGAFSSRIGAHMNHLSCAMPPVAPTTRGLSVPSIIPELRTVMGVSA